MKATTPGAVDAGTSSVRSESGSHTQVPARPFLESDASVDREGRTPVKRRVRRDTIRFDPRSRVDWRDA